MQEEELSQSLSDRPATRGLDRVNPLAAGVLRRNGLKSWTKPAPSLYPHQWSWDSAFIALGLAHVDNRRATSELETLFASRANYALVEIGGRRETGYAEIGNGIAVPAYAPDMA